MQVFYIGVFLLIIFLIFLLVIGGILIWPLFNLSAYLKVLIFPSAVRKKYGSNISGKNSSFFDQAITAEDEENLKKLSSEITSVKDSLNSKINSFETSIQRLSLELSKLGDLPRNKDGTISQRSNAGKEGHRLAESIDQEKREIRRITIIAEEEISSAENSISNIKNKPWRTWKIWITRHGRYLGNRDSLIFMLIGFPVFFFILSHFNLLELRFPTFENIAEIYIYIVFVGPIAIFLDISVFKYDVFSLLINYEQALNLHKYYYKVFTIYNWVIVTLPMPISTLVVYLVSKLIHTSKAKSIEPNYYYKT